MTPTYKQLLVTDISHYRDLMRLFAKVFEDNSSYQGAIPDENYIKKFLSDSSHIILVAIDKNDVVLGGLVAYELKKFEQARSEIYIYDLAVLASHQRKGIGTTLLMNLKRIARERGAYTIFVQADKKDKEALSFYRSLNSTEIETYNFDIEVGM